MRALAIATLLLAASGCSDPTLTVRVDVPDAYRANVATVSLADYELPDVPCDAIAFGDVAAQTLEGALTAQVDTTPGGSAALAGISRVDHKLLVARGLDAGGELIVAGCVALDVVDGDAQVTIATIPAAIVTIDPRLPDLPFSSLVPISMRVLDALGNPLVDRWIVARVFGPKGKPGGATGKAGCPRSGVDDCVQTTAKGNATMVPAPQDHPGPIVVQVHAEWARAQPPLVAGFTAPLAFTFDLPGVGLPPVSCVAYRAANGMRIGCLATTAAGAIEVQHFGWVAGAIVKLPGSPAAPDAKVLLAVPDGATDRVVAIAGNGDWIDGTSGQIFAHASVTGQVTTAQVVPACGKTAFVAIRGSGGTIRSFATDGASLSTFADSNLAADLVAAGCLSDVGAPSTMYRAVVIDQVDTPMSTVSIARVDCPNAVCTPVWIGFGGVGFVSGAEGESRLAIGQLDLSGVIVNEWLIDPSAADRKKELVSPHTHDAVSVPVQIVGGDFDDDDALDRAWLLLGASSAQAPGRLQIVLAATAGDTPITGVSPDVRPRPSALVVGRFDDDGTDDLALFSAQQLSVVLTGKLAVAP